MKTIQQISVSEDYLQFKTDVVETVGKDLSTMAELFFQRAIWEANQNLVNSSIDTALTALAFARYSDGYVRVYIHGFLSQQYLETKHYPEAMRHVSLALAMLNPLSGEFRDDQRFYSALREAIRREQMSRAA